MTCAESGGSLHNGTTQALEQLFNFVELVLDVPEEHLHLQTPGLTRDGAVQALEQLFAIQAAWTSLEKELGGSLYVDALPHEADVKQAILTLREGESWYRIFQGRWRKAVGLHKALQRSKRKMSGKERLEQLEQIANLMKLKEQWQSSPVWMQFLGFPASVACPLEGYLALAKWNRAIKMASEDIQTALIDPISLTAEQARALRREFGLIKLEIVTAIAAVKEINAKFKCFAKSSGSYLLDKVLGKSSELAAALEDRFEWLELQARS